MANRINRAIELLAGDQAIYYVGGHSGHVLTSSQGREDADTWADYINIGMEHGSFDMAGLAEYMQGLIEGGPTRSGHRTPTVIVEAPVNGTDAANVRFNAWQFRQILGRGVHGVLLCQAESADAVRAFVESCRYPHQSTGIDPTLPSAVERMHGATRAINAARGSLGLGTRGRGSEATAAAVWGIAPKEYFACCDPWLSAISKSRAILTRRRCARRANASLPPAASTASRFSKLLHRSTSPASSTRGCGSSPVTAKRPRSSAARTRNGRCRYSPSPGRQ